MRRRLDPFDKNNVHYKRLGVYPTACGQPWLVVTRTGPGTCTDVLADVTCPYCLPTDEFKAQGMEEALSPRGVDSARTGVDSVRTAGEVKTYEYKWVVKF